MGKIDVGTNTFMGEPARIADLLNGFVYRGEERVKAEEVHDRGSGESDGYSLCYACPHDESGGNGIS